MQENYKKAIIALGSNLNNPLQNLQQALIKINNLKNTSIVKKSSFYQTSPIDYTEQPDFINIVILIKTLLDKYQLLEHLNILEKEFGRIREFKNAPRTLDLDIIDYNHEINHDNRLVLPHPRAYQRAFVLIPLLEIEPNFKLNGQDLNLFLKNIDKQEIKKIII